MTDDLRTDKAARAPKPFPSFEPQITKGGRWFVAVTTGVGPISTLRTSRRRWRRSTGFRQGRNIGPANRSKRDSREPGLHHSWPRRRDILRPRHPDPRRPVRGRQEAIRRASSRSDSEANKPYLRCPRNLSDHPTLTCCFSPYPEASQQRPSALPAGAVCCEDPRVRA